MSKLSAQFEALKTELLKVPENEAGELEPCMVSAVLGCSIRSAQRLIAADLKAQHARLEVLAQKYFPKRNSILLKTKGER